MDRTVVVTAAYEQPDGRCAQLAASLVAAASRVPGLGLVMALEDGHDGAGVADRVAGAMPVLRAPTRLRADPPALRAAAIDAALRAGAEVAVMIDYDDVLREDAVHRHVSALRAGASFSYGDMELVGPGGEPLGTTLYSGCEVPEGVSRAEQLAERNFLGFSNTALAASALRDCTPAPAGIVAADWWLFCRLLGLGHRGARVPGAVADYRQYPGNTLGAGASAGGTELRRRLSIMMAHYRAFPDAPWARARLAAIERALPRIDAVPADALPAAGNGPWFEAISRWIDDLAPQSGRDRAS
jgi:hypothetical protein